MAEGENDRYIGSSAIRKPNRSTCGDRSECAPLSPVWWNSRFFFFFFLNFLFFFGFLPILTVHWRAATSLWPRPTKLCKWIHRNSWGITLGIPWENKIDPVQYFVDQNCLICTPHPCTICGCWDSGTFFYINVPAYIFWVPFGRPIFSSIMFFTAR